MIHSFICLCTDSLWLVAISLWVLLIVKWLTLVMSVCLCVWSRASIISVKCLVQGPFSECCSVADRSPGNSCLLSPRVNRCPCENISWREWWTSPVDQASWPQTAVTPPRKKPTAARTCLWMARRCPWPLNMSMQIIHSMGLNYNLWFVFWANHCWLCVRTPSVTEVCLIYKTWIKWH